VYTCAADGRFRLANEIALAIAVVVLLMTSTVTALSVDRCAA